MMKSYKKSMDQGLAALVDIALREDARVHLTYDVAIVKERAVPMMRKISFEGVTIWEASSLTEKDYRPYINGVIGTQGDVATAEDATPQEAAAILQAYWDAIK